jgi:hypothetical protein
MRAVAAVAAAAAAVAWAALPARADKGCTVAGKAVDGFAVEAQAKGGPAIKLWLHGVPAVAHPPDRLSPDKTARIEVRGVLAFDALAPVERVPYKTARTVDAPNGMLHLAAGVEGFTLHARGSKWAEGDLKLGAIVLRGVIVPCDALTLDAVKSPDAQPPDAAAAWQAAARVLHFRAGPGSGTSLDVDVGDELGALELSQVERRAGWTRVTARWPEGTTLTGWVKDAELRKPRRSGALSDAFTPPEHCEPRAPAATPGAQLVSATIAPGTAVSADRLFAWATVRVAEPVTVRVKPGDSWAELVSVPGVATNDAGAACSTALDDAWVPRAAVQLPAAAQPKH